ncbi:Dld1p [Sugiyamaella lignohabitans]|uniref:D-lactate dehydrogenase (cytochrome) n=1 Tax=Sugiyamaella lignohabitans TaxID=796027 RepID=A0A167CFM7_9ASCO|nr:Dld1p [Sugiyamaella lignohabitans]ANB11625.1 Dld1p [Sugiyamaella lignohabitans]
MRGVNLRIALRSSGRQLSGSTRSFSRFPVLHQQVNGGEPSPRSSSASNSAADNGSNINSSGSGSGENNSKTGGNSNVWAYLGVTAIAGTVSFLTAKTVYQTEKRGASIEKNWEDAKYGGKAEFLEALPQLEAIVGKDGVSTDQEDLKAHGYSDWSTYNIDTNPIAIVYPKSTEEVSEIAKICHKYKLPMIGFSGGSSLEGHFSASFGGVCIDFMNMNKILSIRPEDMDVTVQPAVGWMALNEHLEKLGHNLFFAVDPGPTAKIGGMIATSCSGTNCVKYGPMRDHVVNLTVVLADGTIIKTKRRPRKSSAGYNLNHLFCGSEGTLGLITEATLKLHTVPENTSVAVATFPTVRDATEAACEIVRAGIPVQCVEFMDGLQMACVNKAGYTSRKWEEKPTLMFKFAGTQAYIKEQIQQSNVITKRNSGHSFEFASDKEEQHQLWSARKEAFWSILALGPPNSKAYTTDVAVPMSKLADLVKNTDDDLAASGIFGACLGHVGDGNFHATIAYEAKDYDKVKKIADNLVRKGLELEGTCTGEHGVGAGKVKSLVLELGPEPVQLMRTIKLALDPFELLNPGKIFTKESLQGNILEES